MGNKCELYCLHRSNHRNQAWKLWPNTSEGRNVSERLKNISEQFLDKEIKILGYIHNDDCVNKSVKKQIPLLINYKKTKATIDIKKIAKEIIDGI